MGWSGGRRAGRRIPEDAFLLSSFENSRNGGDGSEMNDPKNLDNSKCDLFNDEHKSDEWLTISPGVGFAQSFDGCALWSRKGVLIAAKVRAQENGD